jgi:biotin carboxylase
MPTIGLIVPTSSYRGPDFVAAADELGVDLVLVADASLGIASGRILDVVVADCSDSAGAAAALVERAQRHPLAAVIGVDDAGVMIAALAAAELGLAHNDPASVAATRDKLEMRRLLGAAGVAQPKYQEHRAGDSPAKNAELIGYPLVVKPVSLSGSRGVVRVDDLAGLEEAVARVEVIQAEAGIAGERLLFEEYLEGPEVAVEGLLSVNGLEVLAIFDKPDPLDGPFFEETLYVMPSRHDPAVLNDAVVEIEAATASLGLAFGPIHAELRITPAGVKVVEVAARSIGGLCGRSLKFGMLAQSLEVLLLRAALGMNRRGMRPVGNASGAMMIPIPSDGILQAVRNREAVAEVAGVVELTITTPIGRRIRPLPEGDRYLGFIIARGDTPDSVEESLREANALLDIRIAPI